MHVTAPPLQRKHNIPFWYITTASCCALDHLFGISFHALAFLGTVVPHCSQIRQDVLESPLGWHCPETKMLWMKMKDKEEEMDIRFLRGNHRRIRREALSKQILTKHSLVRNPERLGMWHSSLSGGFWLRIAAVLWMPPSRLCCVTACTMHTA